MKKRNNILSGPDIKVLMSDMSKFKFTKEVYKEWQEERNDCYRVSNTGMLIIHEKCREKCFLFLYWTCGGWSTNYYIICKKCKLGLKLQGIDG